MTENEAIRDLEYLIEEYSAYPPETGVNATVGSLQYCITALKEVQQYREIGTVEECREAAEKLKRAEEALNVILSGNYNDECNFCVHNDNPMANCQCICGDGSWCIHNAKWNGKTSEDENLEGMRDE